jgi:4-hydroxyphenylpyruvate dioxygenase
MVQLIEPDPLVLDANEKLQRIGIGTPDVLAAVATLRRQGVEFNETDAAHTEARGALTKTWLGSVLFELVHNERI